MMNRPSISIRNNQNWLLSYTDLFLLVLSFFVLRFSILKYDLKPSILHKEDSSLPQKIAHKLYFKSADSESNKESISIKTAITTDWFTDKGLSTKGEREIINLSNKMEASKKTATIRLNKLDEVSNEESYKYVNLIIENLKSFGLSNVRLESSLNKNTNCQGLSYSENLACLELDY